MAAQNTYTVAIPAQNAKTDRKITFISFLMGLVIGFLLATVLCMAAYLFFEPKLSAGVNNVGAKGNKIEQEQEQQDQQPPQQDDAGPDEGTKGNKIEQKQEQQDQQPPQQDDAGPNGTGAHYKAWYYNRSLPQGRIDYRYKQCALDLFG